MKADRIRTGRLTAGFLPDKKHHSWDRRKGGEIYRKSDRPSATSRRHVPDGTACGSQRIASDSGHVHA